MYYGHLALWISNKVILRFHTETASMETVSKQHTNIFFTLFIVAFTNSTILISKTVLQYGDGFPVKGLIDIDKPCEH